MTYEFDFDLTKISRSFFRELAKFSDKNSIHRGVGNLAEDVVDRFNIQEATGVPVSDTLKVINDMMDIHAKNLSKEEDFRDSSDRALFLPHCARKYMDNRCEANFDDDLSSYRCQHCSEDCLINKATQMGEKRGYDVFVLPGGSCIPKIMNRRDYDGVVGVACSDEIQLGREYLEKLGVPYQGVPLLKNGCSGTEFNLDTFEQVL